MSGDTAAAMVGLLGALILVGSGLWHRRSGSARFGRLAVIWAAIFLAAWAAVTLGLRLQ